MKTSTIILFLLLAAMLLTGCSVFHLTGSRVITPSDVVVSETRNVSGFTAIDMRTIGHVILTQGDTESLAISGSDNLVPLVTTSVSSGVLVIDMKEDINITGVDKENVLTFTIVVKDLTSLTVSGLADVELEKFATGNLDIIMSGAGQVKLNQLSAQGVGINVSGLGNVEIGGEVNEATIEIPGAGNVDASNLKAQSANVNISGLGNATVWATGELTGTISGGGDVSYYGDPQTSVNTTGLGNFKPLGNK
jgi:hypothetical protein